MEAASSSTRRARAPKRRAPLKDDAAKQAAALARRAQSEIRNEQDEGARRDPPRGRRRLAQAPRRQS
jgi:hypothetical protein